MPNAIEAICPRWSACASSHRNRSHDERDWRRARLYQARSGLKFAGNYHGHFDLALLDAGASANTRDAPSDIPDGVIRDVAVAGTTMWKRWMRRCRGPRRPSWRPSGSGRSWGTWGTSRRLAGLLEGLRERTQRDGALLIFDEVITWLRFGLRGAQGARRRPPGPHDGRKDHGRWCPDRRVRRTRDVMACSPPKARRLRGNARRESVRRRDGPSRTRPARKASRVLRLACDRSRGA